VNALLPPGVCCPLLGVLDTFNAAMAKQLEALYRARLALSMIVESKDVIMRIVLLVIATVLE
jgi:hypothetical protein